MPVGAAEPLQRSRMDGIFIDQARSTLAGGIAPDPLEGDQQPLLEIEQQIDVNDRPQEPGNATS